jgi:hypothetical protein
MVRTAEKVIPVFDRGIALGGTGRGRALGERILLFLEGKDVVYPFDDEQPFEKTERKCALVEWLPVHCIEDVDIGPSMVFTKIRFVRREVAATPELGRNVMGDGIGSDL